MLEGGADRGRGGYHVMFIIKSVHGILVLSLGAIKMGSSVRPSSGPLSIDAMNASPLCNKLFRARNYNASLELRKT